MDPKVKSKGFPEGLAVGEGEDRPRMAQGFGPINRLERLCEEKQGFPRKEAIQGLHVRLQGFIRH